jgi:hypothetical protein
MESRLMVDVYDTGVKAEFPEDPSNWRDQPDPDGDEDTEDEETETPEYVKEILGFDPKELE